MKKNIDRAPFVPSARDIREGYFFGVAEGIRQAAVEASRIRFFETSGGAGDTDRFMRRLLDSLDAKAAACAHEAPQATRAQS